LRSAVFPDDLDGLSYQCAEMLLGIPDGGGRGDEQRISAVEGRDTADPSDEMGNLRSEYAPVGVRLVEHYKPEFAPPCCPISMLRELIVMNGVGIGNEDVWMPALNLGAIVRARVTLVHHGTHAFQASGEPLEAYQLVIR
jgi:hypothetical protein